MKSLVYFFCSFFLILFGSQTLWGQNQVRPVSETRETYLNKVAPIEMRLAQIDDKWNRVVADPTEDSIATAQGWYILMDGQREQLKKELVVLKIEQLKNYYQDILDINAGNESGITSAISEIQQNRTALAPAYPPLDEYIPSTDHSIESLTIWLMNNPQQYLDLTAYLENLILDL